MRPKISVVVPCYNYAHYLPAAVESILAQTFADWEAIIVDDGSTDNTRQIIEGYKDERIVPVFHEKNLGNVQTYNRAIKQARGASVVVLSADDRYLPRFFERTVAMLESHPDAGMVYTGWETIDNAGKFIKRAPEIHSTDGIHSELPKLVLGCHIAQCTAVVRTSVYDDVGLFTYSRAGDWEMWLRIGLKYPIAYVRQPLYQYRLHDRNMSRNSDTLRRLEAETFQILTDILSRFDLPESVHRLKKKAWAANYMKAGRRRFLCRDWMQGVRLLQRAFFVDPLNTCSPRRVARNLKAVVQGIRKSWIVDTEE